MCTSTMNKNKLPRSRLMIQLSCKLQLPDWSSWPTHFSLNSMGHLEFVYKSYKSMDSWRVPSSSWMLKLVNSDTIGLWSSKFQQQAPNIVEISTLGLCLHDISKLLIPKSSRSFASECYNEPLSRAGEHSKKFVSSSGEKQRSLWEKDATLSNERDR